MRKCLKRLVARFLWLRGTQPQRICPEQPSDAVGPLGADELRFKHVGYPLQEPKITRVSPDASIRFQTLEDQSSCIVTLANAPNRGHSLIIDASRCNNDSHIVLDIPKTSRSIVSTAENSILQLRYHITCQANDAGAELTEPMRNMSLIGYDEMGAEAAYHQIAKKVRCHRQPRRHKIRQELIGGTLVCFRYGLRLTVPRNAPAFCIHMMWTEINILPSRPFDLRPIGRCIQGKYPENASGAHLRVDVQDLSIEVSMDEHNGYDLQNEGEFKRFEISESTLRALLPEGSELDGAFISLHAEGKLQAGFACTLPRRPEKASSGLLLERADDNATILAAAKREIGAGRNEAALTALDRLYQPTPEDKKSAAQLRVRALVNGCRFEEAVEVFEFNKPELECDPICCVRYIEACASLGQVDKVSTELNRALFNSSSSPQLLAKLYRYSPFLPDATRSMFAERLLSCAQNLRYDYKCIVQIGHDFANERDWRGFCKALANLELFDLKESEKARISLLMVHLGHQLGQTEQSIAQFNCALRLLGVQPVSTIKPENGLEPTNLRLSPVLTVAGGPLVSVIMTAYNSAPTIGSAIRSVLSQSYRNLELIVVDDHSGDNTREIINGFAQQDSRVTPIFLARNQGTYASKNVALRAAKGEYVTCHDSDDWSHPHKIQVCAERLDRSVALVATGVSQIRVAPGHGLQFRSDFLQPDAPSLMYRVEPVRQALGYYDTVRAGADTEFEKRMKLAFGSKAVHFGEELLSVALWSSKSLTGSDALGIANVTGIMSRPRNDYRREFNRWHERTDRLHIDYPQKRRPFPAPEVLLSEAFRIR